MTIKPQLKIEIFNLKNMGKEQEVNLAKGFNFLVYSYIVNNRIDRRKDLIGKEVFYIRSKKDLNDLIESKNKVNNLWIEQK